MIATASFSSGLAMGLSVGFIAGVAFVLGAAWLTFKLVFLAIRNM
jgi:hypothetical protein